MQLVAYGAQDIYLTGNPQITFFKVVYRRHTNFSMESIKQTLDGDSDSVTDGQQATCTIARNGDLVYSVSVDFTTSGGIVNGSLLIKEVSLEIGGQLIDRHYQEWHDVWNELTTPASKRHALKAMQCDIGVKHPGAATEPYLESVAEAQIPLNFWFCRNPGLALPLIALQYHEVKLNFIWGYVDGTISPSVWCDYIYLDTDERRRFAQVSHEYLIEQLQKEDKTIATTGIKESLDFNHPVKELIWTYSSNFILSDGKLVLNGHDRFAAQKEEYFTLKQPLDYHTSVPAVSLPGASVYHNLISSSKGLEFTGHPTNSEYIGVNIADVNASGELNIRTDYTTGVTTVVFQGASPPSFLTNYSGGMNIVITCVSGIADQAISASRRGERVDEPLPGTRDRVYAGHVFTGTVAAATGKVLVATNKVTLTLEPHNKRDFAGGLSYTWRPSLRLAEVNGTQQSDAKYKITHHHDNITGNGLEAHTSGMVRKIGVYSFALKPEEHQPSGTCNFSRIDNAELHFGSSNDDPIGSDPRDKVLTIYAVNYNVLRIMSGMGGLAYSN